MTLHLLLDIAVAIGIILALSKKYAKVGLALLGLSFIVEAIVAFIVDKDMVQGIIDIVIVFAVLYEYSKAMRRSYVLTKKAKLITGGVLTLLGIWYAAMGVLSPFLVAGVVSVAVTLMER